MQQWTTVFKKKIVTPFLHFSGRRAGDLASSREQVQSLYKSMEEALGSSHLYLVHSSMPPKMKHYIQSQPGFLYIYMSMLCLSGF